MNVEKFTEDDNGVKRVALDEIKKVSTKRIRLEALMLLCLVSQCRLEGRFCSKENPPKILVGCLQRFFSVEKSYSRKFEAVILL